MNLRPGWDKVSWGIALNYYRRSIYIGYMKDHSITSREDHSRPFSFVSRCLFSGAFLGLLIGLFEAALLWTTPRVVPLLVPDVGWVIWFLAPLVDMAFFGLAGLMLGLPARRSVHKEVFVAAYAGLAVTFVYLMVKWFHFEIGLHPFHFDMEVVVPSIVYAASFAASLVFLSVTWQRLSGFAERRMSALMKPLVRGVSAAAVVAIAGIGVFTLHPSFSGTTVRAASPPSGAPNIVFIVMDTVRADHLSSYGYSRPTTPNIDRFARTGVLFENAIAASSWTLASHSSMFTGLLPQQHGADFAVPLASNPWTLAEVLRSRGYQTVGFVANDLYLEKGWGTAQGFSNYGDQSGRFWPNLAAVLLGNAVLQPIYQSLDRFDLFDREKASQINRRVYRWYRRPSQHPYFLFINYFDAHVPYVTSGPYEHRFVRPPSKLMRKFYLELVSNHDSVILNARQRDIVKGAYDNCLEYLDDQVGMLLKFLRQSPEWQNTIVIITSDHGDEFGGHGKYNHGRNLYRAVLHVPLIIAGPGVPQGVRISHVVGTRQLFSTVLDLAGHEDTPFSRTSLARFWDPSYKPSSSDDSVVSELIPINDLSARRAMISLTTPGWQYIAHRDGRQELYRWTVDPNEKDNLAASGAEQATMAGLRSRLVSLVSDATGPWLGMAYLGALDGVAGGSRLSLLRPQPFVPGAADNPLRIGMAQAYFKPDDSAPVRPSQSERDLMRSLPYQ